MDPEIDVQQLQLASGTLIGQTRARASIPRHSKGEKFLKGPIPMSWWFKAMRLPGKALHVGGIIWFYAGIKRAAEIGLSLSRFTELGLSRSSAARGLVSLEQAGLVSVKREVGRRA